MKIKIIAILIKYFATPMIDYLFRSMTADNVKSLLALGADDIVAAVDAKFAETFTGFDEVTAGDMQALVEQGTRNALASDEMASLVALVFTPVE